MTQELTSSKRTPLSSRVRTVAVKASSWQRIALAAILCLSAFLNIFRLTEAGYGNSYYAAAVKDMLTSWHNFFFVSFDAGFVSVDKPPLGLWVQAASAYLFGFSGLSLLLPQAIAGVLSVALLYHLVSRGFGPVAGLVAALALAVTPVAVGVERTNNADGLLTLTVLVAAWAVIRAVESGRLPWLLLGALLVGLGFNMKMLEAYLVLPALYLFYLVASSVSWRRRFVHLGAATVVLLVVSLSWAVAVDLTPADQRPYVGSSSNNSALDLAFGYNGLERLLGREGAPGGGQGQSAPENNPQEGPPQGGGFGPGGARENGEPGPLRLLDAELAGQIGWLLPLAVVGLWAASWQSKRPRLPIDQQLPQGLAPLWRRWRSRLVFSFKNLPQLSLDRRQGALVLWGMWLVTMAVFFSIAGMFHRYYMVMLAPAVAALVGIGVVALWSDYRRAGWRGWLLPLTLLGMATLHTYIILAHYDEDWTPWLPPAIAGLCLFTVGVLVAGRLLRSRPNNARGSSPAYQAGAVAVGILALLIAPTAWAFHTVWQGGGGGLAGAGPQPVQEYEYGGPGGPPPGGGPPRGGPGGPGSSNADSMLMNYLQANRDDAKYLVGTINSMSASPIILSTDEPDPVITLGGFMGRDPVLSTEELANLVDRGAVRFFLMPDRERMEQMRAEYASSQQGAPPWGGRGFLQNESVSWVEDNCKKIPQEEWQSPEDDEGQGRGGPMGRAQALYDCGM